MARIYTNENFPIPVAEELRRLGHDVLTIQETGRAGQAISDESVLAFASAERRAIVTLNRKHFKRLHLTHPDHSGPSRPSGMVEAQATPTNALPTFRLRSCHE
jgi:uncharacterized protein DUF5615